MAVRTCGPAGKTPVWNLKLTRDHLSAMGAITPEGKSIMPTHEHSSNGPDVVRFVPLLTRELPGTWLVI